jgi:hypothetical protein
MFRVMSAAKAAAMLSDERMAFCRAALRASYSIQVVIATTAMTTMATPAISSQTRRSFLPCGPASAMFRGKIAILSFGTSLARA